MKELSILSINDLHVGVQRVSGTTPQTMYRLRRDLLSAIEGLVMQHTDKHLDINGDALDAYAVEMADLLALLRILGKWLAARVVFDPDGKPTSFPSQPLRKLILKRGNHDIAKDSSRLSAFDFLCAVLQSQYPDRVVVITEPQAYLPGHYAIPHLANQELFNLAIEAAIERRPESPDTREFLHLHANYDNNFAVEQDHSLNVSAQQAERLIAHGYHLVFGHEHQQRDFPGITITGNQFPTSIADCLGNDTKRALIFRPDGAIEEIETWSVGVGSFLEIDWQELNDYPPLGIADFLRVTGKASVEEAAKVLQTIAKFRQASDAYVVGSAVKYEGADDDMAELEVAASEMKALDVLEYLFAELDPAQAAVVKKLLEARETNRVAA